MATKINLTIGDQRLLQEVKTRAAANQQALDSRQENANTEAEAAFALEQTVERRNAVPQIGVKRLPAAQSQKKKKQTTGFTGLIFPSPRAITGTNVSSSQSWQQSYVAAGAWSTRTQFNSYSLSTFTVQPYFEKNIKTNNSFTREVFTGFNAYTRELSIEGLDWTVRDQISSRIAGGTKVSSPPPFPENAALLNLIDEQKVVTSCTDTHVYYSIYFRVYNISTSVLTAYNTSNSYFERDSSGRIQFALRSGLTGGFPRLFYTNFTTYTSGLFNFLTPSINFSAITFTYNDIGIYAKCNINTKTVETRYVDLSGAADADPVFSSSQGQSSTGGAYYYFYANLNSDDPHYVLFQQHLSSYSPESFAKRNAYLYNASQWPSSFNYSKTTGTAYVIADPPPGYTGSLRSLLTYQFPTNTSYTTLRGFLGGGTVFTRSYLESLGFTYIEDYNITAGNTLYSAVFPFTASNG